MKKRILSIILVLCMVLTMLPAMSIGASAATVPWSGSGTAGDPYQIATVADLDAMAADAALEASRLYTKQGIHFQQTADIDVGNGTLTPIGSSNYPFSGTYDGGGFKISNYAIAVTTASDAGIFAYNNGTIKNLVVTGFQFTGATDTSCITGGIVGQNVAGGIVDYCGVVTGTAENSSVGQLGGVVGHNQQNAIIRNCYNQADIKSSNSKKPYVGGIVAQNAGDVLNCYNTAAIYDSKTSGRNIGGIVSVNQSAGIVRNCLSTGEIAVANNTTHPVIGYQVGSTARTAQYYKISDSTKSVSGQTFFDSWSLTAGTGWNSNTNVIDSLNAWIADMTNNTVYRVWEAGTFPTFDFGEYDQPRHTHDGVTFTEWTSTNSLPTSGDYYLSADVTLSVATTVSGTLNLCLNGKTVSRDFATEGIAMLTVPSGSTLNLVDGETGGKLSVTDTTGKIPKDTLLQNNGGTVNLTGVTVESKLDFFGGNILLNQSGTMTLTGCTVSMEDNTADTNNLISSSAGTVTIDGGTYTAANYSDSSAKLIKQSGGKLVLKGAPSFTYGKLTSAIYYSGTLSDTAFVDITDYTGAGNITVSTSNGCQAGNHIFTGVTGNTQSKCILMENYSLGLELQESDLVCYTPTPHSHDMSVDCGSNAPVSFDYFVDQNDSNQTISFKTDASSTELTRSVVLTGDASGVKFEVKGTSGKPAVLNLCLNGHTLTGSTVTVSSHATLNICDCSAEKTGKIANYSGICITESTGGTGAINLYGGTITGYKAISINSAATVTLYGGTVEISNGGIAAIVSSETNTPYIYVQGQAKVKGKIYSGSGYVTISDTAEVEHIHLQTDYTDGTARIILKGTPTLSTVTMNYPGRISNRIDAKGYTGSALTTVIVDGFWYSGETPIVVDHVTEATRDCFAFQDAKSGRVLVYELISARYALCGREGCAVSFSANGGTGTLTPTRGYTANAVVTLPDGTGLTNGEKRFQGWALTADGAPIADEDANTAGVQWTVPSDQTAITLYAIWASSVVSGGDLTALDKTTLDGVLGEYNYTLDNTTTPATITLQSDIQLSTTLTFAGVECVFDLNGHAITQAPDASYGGIRLGGDSGGAATKVTIIDTPGGGSVTGKGSYGVVALEAKVSDDVFKIEGGTFTGVECAGIAAGAPDATVSLTITGGKFVGDTGKDGANFGYGGINGVISGGTFTSANLDVGDPEYAPNEKWQLSGGSFDKIGGTYNPALSTLLTPGYTFYKDGSAVSDLAVKELTGSITVAPSPQAKYTTNGTNTVMGSFTDAVSKAQSGSTITLIDDVELSQSITINRSLTIVAEGNRTIKQTADIVSNYLMYTGSGKTLTLGTEAGMGDGNTLTIDGNGKTFKKSNGNIDTGGGLIKGTVKLYTGVTIQNSGTYGIYAQGSGNLIAGGEITSNAYSGVYLYASANAIMSSGKIHRNGGDFNLEAGVYLDYSNSSFTMTGGEIYDEKNGVYLYGGGTFTLDGGKIHSSRADYTFATAVSFSSSDAKFIMESGEIYGIAGQYAAVRIYTSGGSFTMNGGSIYGNAGGAASAGTNNGNITLNGGVITGNLPCTGSDGKNSYTGGAVMISGATPTLKLSGNVQIYDNYLTGTLDSNGKYKGKEQRNVYLLNKYSSGTSLASVTLTGVLGENANIGLSGYTDNIAAGTAIVKSDGTYTITSDDMAKFTWDMTGTNNRKLVLDGESTAAVIKLANALSAPAIGTQPAASTTVTYGAISGSLSVTASLASDASVDTTLSYQWQLKGAEDTWNDIPNATAASFTIPTDLSAGSYTYRCVATATLAGDTQSTTSSSAVVTVSPKAITGTAEITGTAAYGQTLNASYTKGEDGETVTYAWYRSGVTEPIGSGESYTLTAADVGKTITLKVSGTGNYGGAVTSTPTVAVAKVQLTIAGTTIGETKEYDGNVTAAVTAQGTLSGVAGSDGITVTATATYGDKNVGTEKQVTISYAISGGSNQNCYIVPASTTTTAAITAKALTVTGMTATERAYDGTTAVAITGGTLSGLVSDDDVTLGGTAAGTVANADKGDKKPVTITGYTVSGADAKNYSFTQPTGVTVNITYLNPATVGARATSLDGHTISDKPFNITPAYAYTGSAIKPKIKVELYVNGAWVTLQEGRDYELTDYKNNTAIGEAKAAQFSISFKGNYNPQSGIIVLFSITAATLPQGTTNDSIFKDYTDTSTNWDKSSDGVSFETQDGWTVSKTAPVGTDTSVTFDTEGENRTETVYVKDSEGNTYTTEITYSYDKTVPELDVSDAAIGNPTAWKNAQQTITLSPEDTTAGVESVTVVKKGTPNTAVTAAKGENGKYTFTTIGNGEYIITVTDTAGNVTEKTITVSKIDTTKPVAGVNEIENVPESGWFTSDVTVNVTATDANLKEWYYSLDDGSNWTKGTGTSFTITADGDYTDKVKVKAIDEAGNETVSEAASVKLDKAKPNAPTVSAKVGDADYTSGVWTAKDVVFTLTSTQPGQTTTSGHDTYQVKIGSGEWKDITGNTLTVSKNTGKDGESYTFRAVNTAGAEGTATADAIVVKRSALDSTELNDTKYADSALKIGETGIADTWYTAATEIAVTKPEKVGTNENALDATTYYKLWKTGETEPTNGTQLSTSAIAIPNDGEWTLTIWTEDAAGNKTPALTKTIKVDTTKPELDVSDAAIGNPTAWKNAQQTITLSPKDATAGVESVTVVKKGTPNTDVTVTQESGDNAGKYTFTTIGNGEYTITVTDTAGNVTEKTITVSKIDTTKPAITLPSFDGTKWYGATDVSVGVTDGDSDVKTVTVTGGHFTEATDIKTAGKFTATETVAKGYTYTVTAVDNVGNESTETVTINIDLRIDEFTKKVEDLGNSPSYSELAKVVEWFESQTELVKNHIKANDDASTKLEKLTEDFTAAAESAKDGIVTDIGDANTIEEIKDAKRDYDALPEEVKKDIPADVVKELEKKAADADAAETAKDLIAEAAKPGAGYDDKSAAVDAYEKLTDDQKKLIPGSESSYESIKADVDAVDKVIDLIDGLKKPYTKESITDVQDAYNGLNGDQKTIFPANKKAELGALKAMLDKAQAVETLITALTDPYTASEDADIKTAKAAYDKLTSDEKALVDSTLKTKLDSLYKAMLSSKDAAEKAKIEAEKKFTDKVNEALNDPSVDKINDLLKDKEALEKDGNYNDLPQDVKDNVENLEKAKDIIEKLEGITKDNIVDETDSGKLSEGAKDAKDDYTNADKDIQNIVDKATDNKAGDIEKVADALDKISKIPTHKDEVKNDKGEVTKPATGVGEDCEKPVNGSHDNADHQTKIEDAKDALEKLPDGAKDLIPEDKKEQVKDEYEKLVSYLEYINTAKTPKTEIEIVGMTNADKVPLPADSAAAEKTVLEVVATDSRPGVMPKTPTGKNEVLSVDVKLVAKIYTHKDDENPSATQTVQPAPGQKVTVKLLVPNGYKLDTLEIWHVKDGGSRSRITSFTLSTEGGKTYAVFEIASFSHFVFFAQQESTYVPTTPEKPTVTESENGSVEVSPSNPEVGDTVTVIPKADAGYEVDKVKVTDQNGSSVTVTKKPDGSYSFTQPNGKVTITVTFKPEGAAFGDVSKDDWFYEAVKYVYENGLMNGTGDGDFSPYLDTTRGMIVTVLWRLEGEAKAGTNVFDDVAEGAYYAKAVAWAAENKIVEGYGDGKFGPQNSITREQMATILYRYAGYKGLDISKTAELTGFKDAKEVSAYAKEAVSWAVASGLLNGRDDGRLDPKGSAVRCEAAAMLMRFCKIDKA